jgi:SAM-dependent methyltransferase
MPQHHKPRLEAPDKTYIGHRDIVTDSLARYRFVGQKLQGGHVLDIGCGRGYGFVEILPRCEKLSGIDVSEDFLAVARKEYPQLDLRLAQGEQLPFADQSFDAILSFEVIEHVKDDVAYLREIRRVAKPGALIAISTPNKAVSSPGQDEPYNPFHEREYQVDEFAARMREVFPEVEILGQFNRPPDTSSGKTWSSRMVDRIPNRIKYILPPYIQDLFSIALRPPLKIGDVRFQTENLERSPTLLALARLPSA